MLCCFGCVPKDNKSGSNGNRDGSWGRRLKKAKEEEERACREAEQVVQWVRRESARFDASAVDGLVSKEGKLK